MKRNRTPVVAERGFRPAGKQRDLQQFNPRKAASGAKRPGEPPVGQQDIL